MLSAYGNIKTLVPRKNGNGIILQLIRKYDLLDFYGGKRPLALDCIFHDNEGVRIHATVEQQHMEKFQEILVEGNVYIFNNNVTYMPKYLETTGKGAVSTISTLTTTISSGKTLADEHRDGELNVKTLEEIQNGGQYLTNKAALMMGTTSRYITLQTPKPQAYQVFYEYRSVGNRSRSSIMIRLIDGWSAVAEHLDVEQGNAIRFKLCDKLVDCYHVIQIPIVNIDYKYSSS